MAATLSRRLKGTWTRAAPCIPPPPLWQHGRGVRTNTTIRSQPCLNKHDDNTHHNPSVSTLSSTKTSVPLLEALEHKVALGDLHADPAQLVAARRLQRLQQALHGYSNQETMQAWRSSQQAETAAEAAAREQSAEHTNDTASIHEGRGNKENQDGNRQHEQEKDSPKEDEAEPTVPRARVPRGLYLYGPVGTGKSMLMNAFYEEANVGQKQRWHFHAFLTNLHQDIFAMKQRDLAQDGPSFHVDRGYNPVHRVGVAMADQVSLLCLDEFQVTDVADALVLSQLFAVLWSLGTVVVVTSNRPPQDLYQGGLHRKEYFEPFLDLLQRHCLVHGMASSMDYRQVLSRNVKSFYLVDDNHNKHKGDDSSQHDAKQQLDEILEGLLQGRELMPMDLAVGSQERHLHVPLGDTQGHGVASFHVCDLCDSYLGAADYRVLGQHFGVVALTGIPKLTLRAHDRARRFITLVDELYEARTALVCVATVPVEKLFVHGYTTDDDDDTSPVALHDEESAVIVVDKDIDLAIGRHGHSVGALASVQELSFAFERAASRLTEMTSRTWWNKVLQVPHP